jgi:hypothetical protein
LREAQGEGTPQDLFACPKGRLALCTKGASARREKRNEGSKASKMRNEGFIKNNNVVIFEDKRQSRSSSP